MYIKFCTNGKLGVARPLSVHLLPILHIAYSDGGYLRLDQDKYNILIC